MSHRIFPLPALYLLMILLFVPAAALGEEEETAAEVERIEAPSRWKQYLKEHFEVHGYLSTAYVSVRNQNRDPIRSNDQFLLGLTEGETFDHRIAALQLRYNPAPRHTFMVQLAHRHFAGSPLENLENDITLDWLFYRFQPLENLELNIGRVPVANGLLNKFRDVGVLLPFFRPSYNFYRDGDFISETVDGLSLVVRHRWASGWRLEVEGYVGEHELLEGGGIIPSPSLRVVPVESDIGLQLRIQPPVAGLELVVGAQWFDLSAASGFNDDRATWRDWFASMKYQRGAWVVQGEYRNIDFPINNAPVFVDNEAEVDFAYLQTGYQLTRRLGLWGQVEWGPVEQRSAIFPGGVARFRARDDVAVSAVYALNEHLVWKAEFHRETFDLARPGILSLDPLQVDLNLVEYETRYFILSFSASF